MLNIEGMGSDIVLSWIADEEGGHEINRLMGFSSRGELPALVIYSSPESKPAYVPDVSLSEVLASISSRDDLRVKFRYLL